MRDRESDETTSLHPSRVSRGRGPTFIGFAFAAVLGSCLLGFPGCSRRPYTCAVCRENKVDHTCLGLKWSDREETDCSRWYRENVEPSHTHIWIKCTYCRRFGIPGVFGGYGCVIGGPLTGFSRTVQIQIYQHFEDRLEAKRLFIRLGRTDGESSRTWDLLMGWVNAGYPGAWDDWRKTRKDDPDL